MIVSGRRGPSNLSSTTNESGPGGLPTIKQRSSRCLARSTVVQGQDLGANLKFFFEGEEEAGSPHLERIVEENKDLLKADAWFICDGPVHQSRRQQLYFGVRGVAPFEITSMARIENCTAAITETGRRILR